MSLPVTPPPKGAIRETFASRLGLLASLIGVAVGLGNVWRFPYMVGRFGGAAFVLVYIVAVVAVGIPALMAEWSLGRSTRRGPVGAFSRAGFPRGGLVGWALFAIMAGGLAYYVNAVGWVIYYGLGQLMHGLGVPWNDAAILPPETGFDGVSLALQLLFSAGVLVACARVTGQGLQQGIEQASKVLTPILFLSLLILIARSLTLPGASEGLRWYLLKFEPGALTPGVLLAAIGQAVFSLSLGGTMMVVYGSYLGRTVSLGRTAAWTAFGDLTAGLLAGLAILPAVFALGFEPGSGPGLIFQTLPEVFARLPLGWFFGFVFFGGLSGAALLSAVAAFEVLVAGLTDGLRWSRERAVRVLGVSVLAAAMIPMLNMQIFLPWDLAFGSGMQTLGVLLAVLAVGWSLDRAKALRELTGFSNSHSQPSLSGTHSGIFHTSQIHTVPSRRVLFLYFWLRYVIPGVILALGVWWVMTELPGAVSGS